MNFFDGVVIICNGKGEETERRTLVNAGLPKQKVIDYLKEYVNGL